MVYVMNVLPLVDSNIFHMAISFLTTCTSSLLMHVPNPSLYISQPPHVFFNKKILNARAVAHISETVVANFIKSKLL